jgi:hypothetical protein
MTPEDGVIEEVIPKITYNLTIFSAAELLKPQTRRQPEARFLILPSNLEWADVHAQLKIKAVDVLFPQQAAVNDQAFEVVFSITRHVPVPVPLSSHDDYQHLVRNAIKLKANPAVKIIIKEVPAKEGVRPIHWQLVTYYHSCKRLSGCCEQRE